MKPKKTSKDNGSVIRVNICMTKDEHATGKRIAKAQHKGRFSAWVVSMIEREGKRLGVAKAL